MQCENITPPASPTKQLSGLSSVPYVSLFVTLHVRGHSLHPLYLQYTELSIPIDMGIDLEEDLRDDFLDYLLT
jgi:hypothetical protein